MPGATAQLKRMTGSPLSGTGQAFTFRLDVSMDNPAQTNGIGFAASDGSGAFTIYARNNSAGATWPLLGTSFFNFLYPAGLDGEALTILMNCSAVGQAFALWDGTTWQTQTLVGAPGPDLIVWGHGMLFLTDLFNTISYTGFVDNVGLWTSTLDVIDPVIQQAMLDDPLGLSPDIFFGGCTSFITNQANDEIWTVTRGTYVRPADCSPAVTFGKNSVGQSAQSRTNVQPLPYRTYPCETNIRRGM